MSINLPRRRLVGVLAALGLAAGLAATSVSADTSKLRHFDSAKAVPGQYIVVLNPPGRGVSASSYVASQSSALARQAGGQIGQEFKHVLHGFVLKNANPNRVAALANNPNIAFIEADQTVSLSATQSPATWGLDRIDQTSLPLNNSYVYDTTASTVHAYVIDTGIRLSHNEFGGRAVAGYTAINDGNGTNDCNGHGTHVAGTVGGSTYGVAKGVKLYAVRVLNCQGSGTNSGVIAGMDWVAANHQSPAVANMSLGGGASSAVDTAVANATNAGVTMVVAAGNENTNACNGSPARAPSAITVASSTSSDARSSFSNYGSCVDIFAPGSSITSAWYNSNSATNTISGTSMAAPHVAGAAALYLASDPTATPSQVTNALVASASMNKISGVNGSPNLLLNTNFDGGTPPPPPPPGDTELDNGESVGSLSGSTGSWKYYTISIPSGASDLSVSISGGSGDADLYVRRGSQPTTSSYDCRPYRNGNNETCSFSSPAAGTWHIGIRAYTSYSGVTLSVNWTEPGGGGGGGGFTETNLSASSGQWLDYSVAIPAGTSNLTATISGGSGDADLYVRYNALPTTSSYNCRPYRAGNNETCSINNPSAGTWYVSLRAYSSFSGVTLTVSFD